MSDPFLGEIRIFAGNFAPRDWALCNGPLLAISQNAALYSLIGTYYGGNGVSTFQLPNFSGSAAVAAGNGNGLTPRSIGEQGGEPTVTLLASEMPLHSHPMMAHARGNGLAGTPQGTALASGLSIYGPKGPTVPMAGQALSPAGSSLAHNNLQPYLMLSFIICLRGIFPPRG